MEKSFLLILTVIAAIMVAYPFIKFRRWLCEQEIKKWAHSHQLKIVKWEENIFFTPFPFFTRSRGQKVCKVTVKDKNNELKTAWLKLGHYWLGFLKSDVVCKWEDN